MVFSIVKKCFRLAPIDKMWITTPMTLTLFVLLFTVGVFGDRGNSLRDLTSPTHWSNASEFTDGINTSNSVDLEVDDEKSLKPVANPRRLARISDFLDVFNIGHLESKWDILGADITANCSSDMLEYLDGLRQGKLWAMKMDDATGHYSSGFFYGNNYWMGSLSLCESIYKAKTSLDETSTNISTGGLPFSNSAGHISVSHHNPPFIPGFYVLKVALNETSISPVPRVIHIGVCLPSSCTLNDVREFAAVSQKFVHQTTSDILDIRSPTAGNFDLWSDRSFLILMVVSTMVSLLLVLGTAYDIFLTQRLRRSLEKSNKELTISETSSGIGCNSSDYSGSDPHDDLKKELKDLSVVIQLPTNVDTNHSDLNLAEDEIHEPEKVGVLSELLLSFSIITNFNAICDRTVGSDTIPSIHGLRAFSMAWVILGHTCIVVFKYSDNMEVRKVVEKNFLFQAVTNGTFSVDTFFFISGFLVSYIYFRTNAKGKLKKLTKSANGFTAGALHFFGLVFYRFLRLTAPYLFVLGVVEVTMKYLNSNSVFEGPTNDHINCEKYWWRNVLYINTLFPVEDMCMLWSWYLSNDTQFYIFGAVILIIAVRRFRLASGILIVFLISSWITTGIIAFTHKHMPNTDDPLALFDKIYDKPWTRMGPYLIGMCVGWILFKTNGKVKMRLVTVLVGWVLTIACLFFLIFGLYKTRLPLFVAATYSSLSHSVWAVALAWITIACSSGFGGFINSLLSAPCLYPFSRVTYCAYLVHPLVIRCLALNSDAPLHLGCDSMVVTFCGLVMCSYLLSFAVSLSFEAPVVTMLKILSPNRRKRLA